MLSDCCSILQDASCSRLKQPDSIRLPVIGALHAVVEGNKANQLSFQAAGGVDVIMHLLVQASPWPQVHASFVSIMLPSVFCAH